MATLTLDQANAIVSAALARGAALGLNPLSVAVLDAGGHLVAFQRQDNSSIMRFEIATGKAWGALGMGRSSRGLAQVAAERPAFVNSLMAASGGRVVPVPGGVLVTDAAGATIGAVGITGDTSDNDEDCALTSIKAAGLVAGPD
jgi:uncharacterized protein GlcG (DUF336 family)